MKRIIGFMLIVCMVLSCQLTSISAEETKNVYRSDFIVDGSGNITMEDGFSIVASTTQGGEALTAAAAGMSVDENGVLTIDSSQVSSDAYYKVAFPKTVGDEKATLTFDMRVKYWFYATTVTSTEYSNEGWHNLKFCQINGSERGMWIDEGFINAHNDTNFQNGANGDTALLCVFDDANTYKLKIELDQTASTHTYTTSSDGSQTSNQPYTKRYQSNPTHDAEYIEFYLPAAMKSIFELSNFEISYDVTNESYKKTVTVKDAKTDSILKTITVECGAKAVPTALPTGDSDESSMGYFMDKACTEPAKLFSVTEDMTVYTDCEKYIINENFGSGFVINSDGTITTDSGFIFTATQDGKVTPDAVNCLSVENGVLTIDSTKVIAPVNLKIGFAPIKEGTLGTLAYTMAITDYGNSKTTQPYLMGTNGIYKAYGGAVQRGLRIKDVQKGPNDTTLGRGDKVEYRYTWQLNPSTNTMTAQSVRYSGSGETKTATSHSTRAVYSSDWHSVDFNIDPSDALKFTLDDIVLIRDNTYGTLAETYNGATSVESVANNMMYYTNEYGLSLNETNITGKMWFDEEGKMDAVENGGCVRLIAPEKEGNAGKADGSDYTGNAYGFVKKEYVTSDMQEYTIDLTGNGKTLTATYNLGGKYNGVTRFKAVVRGVPDGDEITAE